jgi:hypothetical protein
MKVVSSRMALYTAVLIAELQAKIDYCKTCHGFSGQGYRDSIRCRGLPGSRPSTSRTS